MSDSQHLLPLRLDVFAEKRAHFLAWTKERLGTDRWTPEAAAHLEVEWYASALEARPELFDPYYGHPFTDSREGYFASGSNHVDEIAAIARAGCNVGVAVQQMDRSGRIEAALLDLAGLRTRVFVDSGAYSETRWVTRDGHLTPTWPVPISEEEWLRRLAIYRRLARGLRHQLWCVAPDRVADQHVTLEHQIRHREALRAIASEGAHVILPVQKGPVPMAVAWTAVVATLGPAIPWVAGIPMHRDATSRRQLEEFLAGARPCAIHLLGIGPTRARFRSTLRTIRDVAPHIFITSDSALLRRLVGRENGTGRGARAYTAAQDDARSRGLPVKLSAATMVLHALSRLHDERACASGWRDPELEDDVFASEEPVLRRVG